MNYQIIYKKPALKFLKKQTVENQKRIVSAIHNLPQNGDIKQMAGHENLFRLRVGDFRIIYSVEDDILTVFVLQIGNRGDIYKKY